MPRLKEILQQQRKKNFVGRQNEICYFEELVKQPDSSVHLLYVHGPAGQGKTTLLKQFVDICKETAIPVIYLDCRHIEALPNSFIAAFHAEAPFENDVIEAIEASNKKVVVLIDTYEKLKPLDDWVRGDFLPELPGNVITVISSRSQLSTSWKSDPGWQGITKVFNLGELSEEESKALLHLRNINNDQAGTIVNYAHGNPLALSIIADMINQYNGLSFDPLASPDIMKTLLDQFIQEVPSPAHKAALELTALVYMTSEKMIEEVIGTERANGLFNWLTTLSFIEKGTAGIYPHDLVRDAIAVEMHWRNPEWYKHLKLKVRQFLISKLLKQTGDKQRESLFNLIFLEKMNPAVKPFFEFHESFNCRQDKIKESDKRHIIETVKKYEGDKEAARFSMWIDHEAADVWVFRDAGETPAGFVLKINMEKIDAGTNDAVIDALLPYKKKLHLEKGQLMTLFRTWMSRDHYQNVCNIQSAIFLGIAQYYFTPRLGISMHRFANPEFWQPILNYADHHYVPELEHSLNEKRYGWYMHDWRQRPPSAWLQLMGQQEFNEVEMPLEQIESSEIKITEQNFIDAVYDALKHLNNPKKIIGNKLLKCRFVQKANDGQLTEIGLALTLADELAKAITSLENLPKEETLHRVLYRTFVNPVGSQEQTADFLYMSFSTYRRQVKKAVERIADILWLKEQKIS